MTRYLMRTVSLVTLIFISAPRPARADPMTMEQFILHGGYTEDIKKVGIFFLAMQYPNEAENVQKNFSGNFWSTQPDVKWTPSDAETARQALKSKVDDATKKISEFAPQDLSLVGVDHLGVWKCMDWYYMAVTSKGPLLLRVSVEYKDHPRIMDFQLFSDWDKIKAELATVEVKAEDKVMTIHFETDDKK